MSLTTLWERLAGREAAQKRSLDQRWEAAVKALADGKEPAGVEQLLDETRKRAEDLRADVERLLSRRRAAEDVEAARAVDAETAKVDRQMADAQAAYNSAVNAAERKLGSVTDSCGKRLAELEDLARRGHAGVELLCRTSDPSLGEQVAAAEALLREAHRRQRVAADGSRGQANEAQKALAGKLQSRDQFGQPVQDERAAECEEKAAAHRAAGKRQRELAEGLAGEVLALERQFAELSARRLEP